MRKLNRKIIKEVIDHYESLTAAAAAIGIHYNTLRGIRDGRIRQPNLLTERAILLIHEQIQTNTKGIDDGEKIGKVGSARNP